MNNKKKVLYLSYTGMLEPLGRSQVLAYLSRLASNYEFTIISFEKKQDFVNEDEVAKLKAECKKFGINWQPKTYHKNPKVISTLWDMLVLFYTTYLLSRGGKADIVHCRSYITGAIGMLSGFVTNVPFVFDMRALLPEELIDAKRIQKDSFLHKTICLFERLLLKRSAVIISLTEAAIPHLINQYEFLIENKFTVIPTCVDLSRFGNCTLENNKKPSVGTMGTLISGWYHVDWLAETLKASDDVFEISAYKIITKDDSVIVKNELAKYGFTSDILTIKSSSLDDVESNIKNLLFGILYFTSGTSKLGSAPTRMAEFLACGIPILGNRGVGDMAAIIEKYNIGIVIESGDKQEIIKGLKNMKILLEDNDLKKRCKQAAKEIFSADMGAKKYNDVYMGLTQSKRT